MRKMLIFLSCLALIMVYTGVVSAVPLPVGGGWTQFDWISGEPTPTTPSPWNFTLPGLGELDVTDCFLAGDVFEVLDRGTLLGNTSWVSQSTDWTNDPDFAFSHPAWAHGSWALGPGNHEIIINTIQNPYNYGSAYVRVFETSAPVPEPTTMLLLGSGLLGLAGYGRKKFFKK